MDAKNVTPAKWHNDNYPIRVLYDDGDYSVIWGKFEGTRAMGARWNGSDNAGYPSLGGNPTWYVEPDFLATAILHRLLTAAIDEKDFQYIENIKFAIKELNDKMTKNKPISPAAPLAGTLSSN